MPASVAVELQTYPFDGSGKKVDGGGRRRPTSSAHEETPSVVSPADGLAVLRTEAARMEVARGQHGESDAEELCLDMTSPCLFVI